MSNASCNVLLVVGSLHENSITRVAINHLADNLSADGCDVHVLDFEEDPLSLFNPDTVWEQDYYPLLKEQIIAADVIVLGTPDYHGSISSTLKNFLDHFWREFAGKLFATIVAGAAPTHAYTARAGCREIWHYWCIGGAPPSAINFRKIVD